ncbi:hypothetical protein B0T12DRAFT_1488 [Alternaria alternata]|uniref:Uncharacterized protein n=1 Tax=Alternaria tenuissima TaxID=119927 RepID=A0A4Q4MXA7_9PLEO|nr:hypothetical protein B0T12DRAFT_1488 [Alternaria alternata]RYN60672.1 hypothetical protein AA0114_g703 [Alternaria tenuissima]
MAEIEAHTEGHETKTFEPTFPTEQTSLPFTQASRRDKVPAASGDKQNYEQSSAPQEFDEPIQYSKKQSASNGGFQWITGNRPDGFKTKHVMQKVRQTAMGSYLKGARKMAESRTSVGSQDAPKPRSTQSLKGKRKKTSEIETPSKAIWKKTEPSVEDLIDGSSTISTTSDPMESVFSAESSGTSMTVSFRESLSGLSRELVEAVTRVFVSVIQSDQVLGPIYESGRNDPAILPRELRRDIYPTLLAYAQDLENEAKNPLEYVASSIVRTGAGHAARCVSGDYKFTHGPTKDADDSSDGEVQEQSVVERQFNDDVDAFRSFLIQSNAFATLRTETQLLYPFQPTMTVTESFETYVGEDIPEHTEGGRSGKGLIRTFNDTAMFMIINLLVSLECLDPPLATGWTRIKIECHTCGERYFDDVLEHREGGIAQLKQWMERALNATITVVHPNEEAASTHGRWHSPALVHNILRGLQKIFRWGKHRADPVLPEHNGPQLESEPRRAKSPSPQRSSLRLMSCVHRNWEHRILLQDRVDHINTDRKFFTFLKTQVRKRRSRVMRVLSCRKIQAIHFTMFRLRMGNRLEVRDHRDCCKASCNCLPPRDHPDYDFACPLDSTYPVIPPRAFAHMLKHTTRDVHEDQTHIYRWVPKRKGTTLDVDPKTELTDAWGLYFEEGWDPNDIMTLFSLVFVVSLIFLVCWSKYTSDVSAASGVSSYMITVAGIAISLLVIRAGNM